MTTADELNVLLKRAVKTNLKRPKKKKEFPHFQSFGAQLSGLIEKKGELWSSAWSNSQ